MLKAILYKEWIKLRWAVIVITALTVLSLAYSIGMINYYVEFQGAFSNWMYVIGKSLLLKVSDIMHSGDRVPVVDENTSVKETILEMTSKGFGVTAVLSKTNVFVGVVTDGDLRRALERDGNIIDSPIIRASPDCKDGKWPVKSPRVSGNIFLT